MSTSSDSNVIQRDSIKKGLVDIYNSNAKAGGAFNAYSAGGNTMLQGLGPGTQGSQKSQTLTIEPGFTTGMANDPRENFKETILVND